MAVERNIVKVIPKTLYKNNNYYYYYAVKCILKRNDKNAVKYLRGCKTVSRFLSLGNVKEHKDNIFIITFIVLTAIFCLSVAYLKFNQVEFFFWHCNIKNLKICQTYQLLPPPHTHTETHKIKGSNNIIIFIITCFLYLIILYRTIILEHIQKKKMFK